MAYLSTKPWTQNALHRPVQSALLHYQLTRDHISCLAVNVIDSLPRQTPPSPSPNPSEAKPFQSQTLLSGPAAPAPIAPPTPPIVDETGAITPVTVQTCSQKDSWVLHCANPEDHEPTNKSPSRYLQMACPACHPSDICAVFTRCSQTEYLGCHNLLTFFELSAKFEGFHSSASLDGNFEQARLRHAGSGDQPVPKCQTFFLTPQELLEARRHVDEA
jgi:hypothetical protein